MRLRLTKVGEPEFLACVRNNLWGSAKNRFREWDEGDFLGITVGREIAGLARVTDKQFYSSQRVWECDIFPFRIPIEFEKAFLPGNRLGMKDEVRDILLSTYGRSYGVVIRGQLLLDEYVSKYIIEKIRASKDDLSGIRANLDVLYKKAKDESINEKNLAAKNGVSKKGHSEKAESNLVQMKIIDALANIANANNLNVWIKASDTSTVSLPEIGLSKSAMELLRQLDTIWYDAHNLPIALYSLTNEASLQSALFVVSDLILAAPILTSRFYILAPERCRFEYLKMLERPTFSSIKKSERVTFLSYEDIEGQYFTMKKAGGMLPYSLQWTSKR